MNIIMILCSHINITWNLTFLERILDRALDLLLELMVDFIIPFLVIISLLSFSSCLLSFFSSWWLLLFLEPIWVIGSPYGDIIEPLIKHRSLIRIVKVYHHQIFQKLFWRIPKSSFNFLKQFEKLMFSYFRLKVLQTYHQLNYQ